MKDENKPRPDTAADRKARLLRLFNHVMLGAGILFLGYLGVMYVLFFLHTR
ncbi:MAG: hypothetical protein JW781_02070 [Deltaproteobacteria bacterium]|nr:hypothetical protein [Candidatus Anaeroferrophillacea bacterium]